MKDAYIEAALWSSTYEPTEGGYRNLDDGEHELSPEAQERMEKDCDDFLTYLEENEITHDDWDYEQLGHDFWLTRNGHGMGFWDRHSQLSCASYMREHEIAIISRDFSKREALDETCDCPYHQGQRLAKAAKKFGECDLYVGDDSLIYVL